MENRIIEAISNRIDRINKYQDQLEKMMEIDNDFSAQYFEQEAIKNELSALLDYIETLKENNGN